jgi:hypothetical protein
LDIEVRILVGVEGEECDAVTTGNRRPAAVLVGRKSVDVAVACLREEGRLNCFASGGFLQRWERPMAARRPDLLDETRRQQGLASSLSGCASRNAILDISQDGAVVGPQERGISDRSQEWNGSEE